MDRQHEGFGLTAVGKSIIDEARHVPPPGYVHDNRWSQGIKRHIAYALLAYTLLLIFLVSNKLGRLIGAPAAGGGMSIMPYMLLVMLVVGVIPAARRLERKWERLGGGTHAGGDPAAGYRRDAMLVWAIALGLPVALRLLA